MTLLIAAVTLGLDSAGTAPAGRWVATLYVSAYIAWTVGGMVGQLLQGRFGLDVLAVISMVATLLVGEYLASLIIVLMLAGGRALEDFATGRAERDLTSLLDRSPRTAHVVHESGLEDVDVRTVAPGDELLVRPAELVPVDGTLLSAAGEFDQSSLTGESVPVFLRAGDEVPSGSINGAFAVRLRVLRASTESQYQQIVALVEDAQRTRAPVVRLADRFALPFTAVALIIGGLAWWLSGSPTRFAEVLVLATPCPLLIAAPVAFLGGLSRTARAGIVLKGGAVIEVLARVRSVAMDKTGTLTQGRPILVEVRAAAPHTADDLLRLAASAEQYSTHVLADGIRQAALDRGLPLSSASQAQEVATNGVTTRIGDQEVAVGKLRFIADLAPDASAAPLASGETAAYVAIGGAFAGALILADGLRPEAPAVIDWLRMHGVDRVVMLTGDARETAVAIAAEAGITDVHAELRPGEKVALAAEMRPRPVMMIGDGVNDAPVLAAADIGVAMGVRGATAAGDAADAVILRDSLTPIIDAIAISRHTLSVAITAIWIGIGMSVALMLAATTGAIPAVVGALLQEAVDLATILYALRALAKPRLLRASRELPVSEPR